MALFNKKPKVVVCDMCGRSDVEGCGSASKHVVQILGDDPAWLPPSLRSQAQGEYAWLCLHCNSYPALKWASEGAAHAGMLMHLGRAHHRGQMKVGGTPPPFDMIAAS
jgi:hypothetical protein